MTRLVKGAKETFGWVVVGADREVVIPPEAWNRYGFQAGEEAVFIPGSRKSGGFAITTQKLLDGFVLSMGEDRIWGYDGSDLLQQFMTQDFAFDRQSASLVVVQQDAFLPALLFEYLILSDEILNDLLLLAVGPTGKDNEDKLPGLEDEIHDSPDADSRCKNRESQHLLDGQRCQAVQIG